MTRTLPNRLLWIKGLGNRTPTSSASSNNITNAPNLPWTVIGDAETHLLQELTSLYWEGVKRELEVVLLTLKKWQEPEYSSVVLDDEEEKFIHGFDSFIDQVSQESRAFAVRYGEGKHSTGGELKSYKEALHAQALDISAESSSSALKGAVRMKLEEIQQITTLENRAKMLLQSAGFLDIDKLIEHRPPLHNMSFWKKPSVPQLTLTKFDKYWIPIFSPARCSSCSSTLRGSMFHKTDGDDEKTTMCEECYRESHYGHPGLVKVYKHCILEEVITPGASRNICRCSAVPHFDSNGRSRVLFPVGEEDKHRSIEEGGMQCGLLKLGELVAEAKYDGMQTTIKKRIKLGEEKRMHEEQAKKNKEIEAKIKKKEAARVGRRNMKTVTQPSLHDAGIKSETSGKSVSVEDQEADGDIPFFLRKYTEKYPFGNVHMALRVGPLIIENGVSNTKGGALVTIRDPPNLQAHGEVSSKVGRRLALSTGTARTLWTQPEIKEKLPKRYKAAMKQVAGASFSGILDPNLERDIIKALIKASQQRFDDPGLHATEQRKLLDQILGNLLSKLKHLIESRVSIYLGSVAKRLLDPLTELHWSATSNNCQNFCDMLIDWEKFGPMIGSDSVISEADGRRAPLYTMSFVCRPSSYTARPVNTKFDVPSGLTEEYLLKFRYGIHDEADIIDSLQEYWYDWGTFGGPLYEHQDLFPWDCTEAYGRYPVSCNNCNISKHVWAFPFDSWSIISLHLSRDRYMYAPESMPSGAPSKNSTSPLSNTAWMRNRLKVLLALDSLLSAAGAMASDLAFRASTSWLHKQRDASLDRLKLGGIHRAQPFSHYFEQGKYYRYFIAEWAHLKRKNKIEAYELLRDGRVKLWDVPTGPYGHLTQESRAGRGGWGGGIAAGAVVADGGFTDSGFGSSDGGMTGINGACAGGCGANCGSGGCASGGCGGGGGDGGGGGGCGGGGCGGGGCGGGGGGCGGCCKALE
ncbi:hypothetical protein B0O99DRAFT_556899 [Bisporella sp. PMI_857]|nr:hypothetical protein B0O99DRAFT_556899 [Bisporella sp. PMI_857]